MNNIRSDLLFYKKNYFNPIFLISLLLLITGIVILASNFEKNHIHSNIVINGLKYSSSREIDSIIELSFRAKRSKLDIIKAIENLSYIQSCNIFTLNPETLIVDIRERKPIAKFYDSLGKVKYIDEVGNEYSIQHFKNYPKVPLLINSPHDSVETISIINVLKKFPERVFDFIGEIAIEENHYLFFCKSTRTKILLPIKNVLDYLPNIIAIFNQIETTKILNASVIDCQIKDRIIIR